MKFLNKSKHTALKTMTEFKAIGLVDMDDFDINVKVQKQSGPEYTITTTTKQITLKEGFKWFLTEEFDKLREGFVATDNREYMDIDNDGKKTESDSAREKEKRGAEAATRAENRGGTHTIFHFWSVYDELEKQELGDPSNRMSVDKDTISHKKLHQALVSSGHFYQGDATQIIKDMINAGRLKVVSFETYKRGGQQ